jgi:adenosylmethionine-8-amino-7-oxononanoate aminotransferase
MTTRSPVWHPFTQHAVEPDPFEIIRTEGAHLITSDGRRIIDAISSWWVTTHGHRHPLIQQAIRDAADSLDQLIFAGFTHAPAEQLARGLIAMAPDGLAHVFFSDSGSTAVEVGLKMALGAFHNRGEPRGRIAVLEHGYHGDTVGAMSVGARGPFTDGYAPLLFDVDTIPFPDAGRDDAAIAAFERLAETRRLAALLVEPLVLGAGGMRMYAPRVLAAFERICRATGTLLIVDEVMTGWGRTGTLFACTQAGVVPDILCTGKGLTGGSLPLAATLATRNLFDAHWSSDRRATFFHSSSYTANPLACAAAVANIAVWRDEPVLDRISALTHLQARHAERLRAHPKLTAVRQCGTILACDVVSSSPGYFDDIGPRLRRACLDHDVLVRPLGNVIYVMPPYCISAADLERVWDVVCTAVDTLGSPP